MYLDRLFKLMAEKQASDLFISCGAPINIKVNGVVAPDLDASRWTSRRCAASPTS